MADAARIAPLVAVMGASGAGKDTLLRQARLALAGGAVQFAHRYITRPPHGDENFVALSAAEFAARKSRGLFAFDWQAHGFSYGIGAEIELWRNAGCPVVFNASREHFTRVLAQRTDVRPVLITAPPAIIAARLRARGRDTPAEIEARVARASAYRIEHPRLVTIVNDGPPEAGGAKLADFLRSLVA